MSPRRCSRRSTSGLPLGTFVALHALAGREVVLLLLATIVVSDTAQYFTGRWLGRHEARRRPSAPRRPSRARSAGSSWRRSRWSRSRHWWLPGRTTGWLLLVGLALVGSRHRGRPVRVAAQAERRRQGQLGADPGARRRARSDRRDAVRGAGVLRPAEVWGLSAGRETPRDPRIDRIDRAQRPVGGRVARGPAGGRRDGRRRQRARCSPSRWSSSGRAPSRWRRGPRSTGCASTGAPRRPKSRGTGRTGWWRSPRAPTSTWCCAPRRARRRSRPCSRRSRRGRRSRWRTRKCSSWPARSMTDAARRRGVEILPVDSEHNAIHQCVHGRPSREISRLILTASGGPFRGHSAEALAAVAPRRRAEAPDVADGAEDHDRLGDADEQGARGHRGAVAVRRPARSDRRRRAPAVGRALDGGDDRRVDPRAARRHRHAAADPVRLLVSRTVVVAAAAPGPRALRAARLPPARPREVPRPAPRVPGPRNRRRPAGRAQRGQRGGRRGVPRGTAGFHGHPAAHRPGHGRAHARSGEHPRRGPRGGRLGSCVFPGARAHGTIGRSEGSFCC